MQVRKEQESERELVQTERLAVLALASYQAAVGDSNMERPVQQLQPMYTAPAYIDVAAPSVRHVSMTRSIPASMRAVSAGRQDVLGIMLPGLLMCGMCHEAYKKFAKARDSLFESAHGRVSANAVSAALLAIVYASNAM
jgi:hypothetical protein